MYLAWFIFVPFLIVVATAVALSFLYGPNGPWVTLQIAPVLIAASWVAIWLHAWYATYDLPAPERKGELSRISVALVGSGLLVALFLLNHFTE